MRFSMVALLLAATLTISTQAAEADSINTHINNKEIIFNKEINQTSKDPILFAWNFQIQVEPVVEEVKTAQEWANEKKIERWKEKQATLWQSLPTEPFTINASAYTAAADECGKSDGITASGLKVKENRTLACPSRYPFGAKIAIEGMGVYTCEDRGGAIKGNHFDIYMETKKQAFAFGRQHLTAEVVME